MSFTTFCSNNPTTVVISMSAFIAWRGLIQARKLSIQKNTLDFDNVHGENKDLLAAYVSLGSTYRETLSSELDSRLRSYATDMRSSEQAAQIRLILNTWERVGRGIQYGVYDKDMLYRAFSSHVLNIYSITRAYRLEVQKDSPSFYECFEKMGHDWYMKKHS